MHMYKRRDYLSYKDRLKPYGVPLKGSLDEDDIAQLNAIKTKESKDTPWLSRMNTGTHMFSEMNEEEKRVMESTTEKIRLQVEKIIGEKVYNLPVNSNRIYSYHGNKSYHLWHVDPENVDTIYNVILGIDKKGDISPFQFKDKENKIHTVQTGPGDGILFRGGTTVHQVPPNTDPNSKRKVLALSFTTNKDYNTKTSLCTHIKGGSNYQNVIKILLTISIASYICGFLSNIDSVSYKVLGGLVVSVLLICKYLPLYYDTGLGTGRATSILSNVVLLTVAIALSLSIKNGSMFFVYFALSEVFLPRKWVYYD